jgi:hypothetical protein
VVHNGDTVTIEMSEEDAENMRNDQSGTFKIKKARGGEG